MESFLAPAILPRTWINQRLLMAVKEVSHPPLNSCVRSFTPAVFLHILDLPQMMHCIIAPHLCSENVSSERRQLHSRCAAPCVDIGRADNAMGVEEYHVLAVQSDCAIWTRAKPSAQLCWGVSAHLPRRRHADRPTDWRGWVLYF